MGITTHSRQGISLLELMIALSIFAVFGVAFMSAIGTNIFSSGELKQNINIVELAELKMNEIIINPPTLEESLLDTKNEQTFEDFPEYTYALRIEKFSLPDYKALIPASEEEQEDSQGQESATDKIFSVIDKNMQKMLWQLALTITHKESGREHTVSTWYYSDKAVIDLGGF